MSLVGGQDTDTQIHHLEHVLLTSRTTSIGKIMTKSNGTSNLSEVCNGCPKVINGNCPYYASTKIWQRQGGCPFNAPVLGEKHVKLNPLKASKRARKKK